jgi:hypothetical protein
LIKSTDEVLGGLEDQKSFASAVSLSATSYQGVSLSPIFLRKSEK